MKIFDTHCHLNDPKFSFDRARAIARMRAAGVELAVVVGEATDGGNAFLARELSRKYDFLYWSLGAHPHEASKWTKRTERDIIAALSDKKCVALGEIGLDYHYDLSPREDQRRVFARQLEMALEAEAPAIIHIREAHGEAYDIMSGMRLPRGVLHCYTGSWESAKAYLKMGFYISLSGAVTFKNAPKLQEVARNVPIERLLIETDSPYMAPVPMRGRRNEPALITFTAGRVADIRGVSVEELCAATNANARALFGVNS